MTPRRIPRALFVLGLPAFLSVAPARASESAAAATDPLAPPTIPRIAAMPEIPQPYAMRDWRRVTLDYVGFATDFDRRGDRLPVIGWANAERTLVTLPSYIGAPVRPPEALNVLALVVSGSLVGLDMRAYRGVDWVAMTTNWFSERAGVVVNSVRGGTGGSFWYDVYPGVLFVQICALYPDDPVRDDLMRRMAVRWAEALDHLAPAGFALPDFDHLAFDTGALKPREGNRVEPEGGAGIAWIELMAWKKFGDARFLETAERALRALQARPIERNPLYEVLLPYGAVAAARLNREMGRNHDLSKWMNWCFEPRGAPQARPHWGVVADRFGDVDCAGLVGSVTDSGGYAFAMNSFVWAGALAPVARYEPGYAAPLGKWLLNLANAARLFYPDALPASHQDHRPWAEANDPASCVAYEGLRRFARKYDAARDARMADDTIRPHATGDALRKDSPALNLCLYGSSHVGLLGGLVERTDVEGILKIDLAKTDWFRDAAAPVFLLYNPHPEPRTVRFDAGPAARDLYDASTGASLARAVRGPTPLTVAARAVLVVEVRDAKSGAGP